MRERLLAGDELNNREVQAEYGITNDHTVSDAAAKLVKEGYEVVKAKRLEPGPKGRKVMQTYWRVEQEKAPSTSETLRQRILNGDALSAVEVAQEYGVSRSLLGVVLASMRRDGFNIEKERVKGGSATFRLGDPDPAPKESAPKKGKPKSKRAIYNDLSRRFEEGERINAHMVIEDYGVDSLRFLAGFLAAQRKKGWAFTRASAQTDTGWRTFYRLKKATANKKTPAWVSEVASTDVDLKTSTVVDPSGPQEVEFAQAIEHFEGGISPYPQLGTYFRLTLLAEGDPDHCPHCNGELGTPIVYGLRNGMRSLMLQERPQDRPSGLAVDI